MKINKFKMNLKKNYDFFIFFFFIIILFLCIYNFLNYNESFKSKSKSKKSSITGSMGRSRKKYKCQDKIPCNENETILYKCLTKTEIDNSKDFIPFKGCVNSSKYRSQTEANNKKKEFKCKINDDCDDNNRVSYTCINNDNKDKIETSKTNGWSEKVDTNYHKECNSYNCNIQ